MLDDIDDEEDGEELSLLEMFRQTKLKLDEAHARFEKEENKKLEELRESLRQAQLELESIPNPMDRLRNILKK